ncbi:hypothetical protein DSM112329_05159 [Paraconexibacter sp. AEG42_29]|uniref:BON domain-containing protein n=1 Tax=Paraconexibacter sp. AEG42_29 TaxID=2997339 RepID=A0AAU7B2L1_9ACTN
MEFRRPSAVAASLLAVLAVGCGSSTSESADSFKGEPKAVATAIDDLQDASSRRDADEICSELLSAALVEKIRASSKQSCDDAVKDSLRDVDAFKLEVVDNGIVVSGTTATAKVRSEAGKDEQVDTLQLVKEAQRRGGKTEQRWKVSALAG